MKTIKTTETFLDWFKGINDRQAKSRIQMWIDRIELGNYGDCEPVGEGVSEARIHYGPGYRIYFVERGQTIVVLLAGGTKRGQNKDIQTAIELKSKL